jgi:hypothetical protein
MIELEQKSTKVKKGNQNRVPVTHAYDPSYLGG